MTIVVLTILVASRNATPQTISVSGVPVDSLKPFDDFMQALMVKYAVPGGALAVAKDGRLVLSHGYGNARYGVPAQPETMYRIASISKPITSAAVLKLVEQGLVWLDTPAYWYLPNSNLTGCLDSRWTMITVRDLLQHSGGWDRNQSFDPMFQYFPANNPDGGSISTVDGIIDYMCANQPLENQPGTVYAYSNFG